jgi:hypothetical protein
MYVHKYVIGSFAATTFETVDIWSNEFWGDWGGA